MPGVEGVLGRLEGVREESGGWRARCPNPDHGRGRGDRNPSLSVREGVEGKVLLRCHGGCSLEEVVHALGLELTDLFERDDLPVPKPRPEPAQVGTTDPQVSAYTARLRAHKGICARLWELRRWTRKAIWELELGCDGERITFPLRDRDGALTGLARYQPNSRLRDGPNGRKMKTDTGSRRELFPAPERWPTDPIFLLEGEPDAVAARSCGLTATSYGGVNGWRSHFTQRFVGRSVVVVPDCDAPGREAAQKIAEELADVAEVRVLDLAPDRADGHDLTDSLLEVTSEGELSAHGRELRAQAARLEPLPSKGVELCSYIGLEPRAVDWCWKPRIPIGGITLLAGPGGLGKSTIGAWIAARASLGELEGTFAGEPVNVVIASAEDTAREVMVPRLTVAGARQEVGAVTWPKVRGEDRPLHLPNDVPDLLKAVDEANARLVIIDPLVAFIGEEYDSHKDHQMRRVLAPLAAMAERLGIAIVGVLHVNKSGSQSILERIIGTVGFVNAARSILVLGTDPSKPDDTTERILAHPKHNWSAGAPSLSVKIEVQEPWPGIETSVARFNGTSNVPLSELFTTHTAEERSATEEAREFLREELGGGLEVPVKDIQRRRRALDISDTTLRRAKKAEGVRSRKVAYSGEWVWYLPDHQGAHQGAPRWSSPGDERLGAFEQSFPEQTFEGAHTPQHKTPATNEDGQNADTPRARARATTRTGEEKRDEQHNLFTASREEEAEIDRLLGIDLYDD